MKLYKIVRVSGSWTKSVFQPRSMVLPEVPEVASTVSWQQLVRQLMMLGYSEADANIILQAWYYHAVHDLKRGPAGVWVYLQMQLRTLPPPEIAAGVTFWPLVLLAAAFAAIGVAIYLWEEDEAGDPFVTMGHDWVYLMSYGEILWEAEIRRVTGKGIGLYERCGEYGSALVANTRNDVHIDRWLDRFVFAGSLVHEGRPLVFWHRFYWSNWAVFYCGMLDQISSDLYVLREGGNDPYRQPAGWIRPGDRWGTPGYEGAWKGLGFWWL